MDERDEIRSRIDIVSLVSAEVSLRKVGKNFQGLCPFHPDKRPSMTVSPETGRYNCWSCGAKGDIFNWVMARQNVEFGDALRILAKQAGVTLKSSGPREASKPYAEIMLATAKYFQTQLAEDSRARGYCERRGINAEAQVKWMLGYAPPSGDPLAFHLKKQGYALQDAREVFVVDQDGTGAFFDKFRGRLMFPIHDERGNVIAFGGRVLGDEIPKYINSSDTPLYRKSRVLYGFHLAKESISKRRSALLVEGYLDVIACHEAGLTHAVASLGTSATEEQAKLLKRWSDEVVILYDRDEAGQKAADRAIAVMSAEGLRVRVAVLPPGEDPDSLLKKHGAGAVTKVAEAGLPPLDFKIRRIEERLNPAQEEFWQEVISVLATETNELELDRQLVRLAPSYPGLVDSVATQKTLKRTIARVRREKASQERNPDFIKSIRTTTISRSVKDLHSAEVVLFKAFLNSEYRTRAFLFVRKHDLFLSSAGLELAETLTKTFPEQPPTGEPPLWLPKIESDTHRQLLADINDDMRGDILTEDYLADSLMQMRDLIALREAQVQRPKLQSDDERQKYLERLRQLKPTVDDPGDLLKDW